jgi:hypothetical protein
MKKRSFLLPLAVSLAALTAGSGTAIAALVAPTLTVSAAEASPVAKPDVLAPAKPLVLERSKSIRAQFADHYSHRSHSSHSSHSSHRSHYSSR